MKFLLRFFTPRKARTLFLSALATAGVFLAYNGFLLTRGVSLQNSSWGIVENHKAVRGFQGQKNPRTLFGVVEVISKKSFQGKPLFGGVKIKDVGFYEFRNDSTSQWGNSAKFTFKKYSMQFMVYDLDRSATIDESAVTVNTGSHPYTYSDLDLDGNLDVMNESLADNSQQLSIMVDNTWRAATPCTRTSAIVDKDLYVFDEGRWRSVFNLVSLIGNGA